MTGSTDHGTLLEPGQVALVWDPEAGFCLAVPSLAEGAQVPGPVILLTAFMILLSGRTDEATADFIEATAGLLREHGDADKFADELDHMVDHMRADGA